MKSSSKSYVDSVKDHAMFLYTNNCIENLQYGFHIIFFVQIEGLQSLSTD